MKKTLLYLTTVLVATVSCHSEIEPIIPERQEEILPEGVWFKVPALLSGDSQDTKALYSNDDNGFDFKWADGDHITVYSDEEGRLDASIKSTSSQTPDYAIFTGSGFSLTSGKTYYAFYPYCDKGTHNAVPFSLTGQILSGTNSDGSITNFTANDFCWATATCSASGSATFNFKHICAFVKMELTLPDDVNSVSKVTIGTSESIFTTEGTVNLSSGAITETGTSNTIVLTNDTPLDLDDNHKMTAYFALAPVDISKRAIYIIAEGQVGSTTNRYAVTFIPGTYKLEAGKVYTTLFTRKLVENNNETTLSAALLKGGTVLASEYNTGQKNDLSTTHVSLTKNVGLVVDDTLTIAAGSITVGDGVIFTIMGGGTKSVTKASTKAGGGGGPTLYLKKGGIVNKSGAVAIDGANVYNASSLATDDYLIENKRIVRIYSGNVYSKANIVENTSSSYTNTVEINGGKVDADKNIVVNVAAVAQATSKVSVAGGTVNAGVAIVKNEATTLTESVSSSQVTISDGNITVGTAIVTNNTTNETVAASANKVSITGGTIKIPSSAVVKNTDYKETPDETQKAAGAEITGGTFTSDGTTKVDVTANNTVPAGYKQDQDTGEIKPVDGMVAQIGTTVYQTLTEAIAAVKNGETIKMIQNVVLTQGQTITTKSGEAFSLDLNGKTISIAATGFDFSANGTNVALRDGVPVRFAIVVKGDGTFNICDNSAGALGTITAPNHSYGTVKAILVDGNAIVNINSGNISGGYAAFYAIGYTGTTPVDPATAPKPTLNINGGKVLGGSSAIGLKGNTAKLSISAGVVESTGYYGVVTNGTQDWYDGGNSCITISGGTIKGTLGAAMYLPAESPTTITGGCFEGAEGIVVKGGSLTITGTSVVINATGAYKEAAAAESGYTETGSCIYVEDTYSGHAPVVNISAGNFYSKNNLAVQYYTTKEASASDKGHIALTGGTYSSEPAANCIATGYEAVKSGSTWTVEPAFVVDAEGVYHIYSLGGLKMFRDEVNASTSEPFIFETATIKLEADINLNNDRWTPINCQQNHFGTFDGNNKTISYFKITADDAIYKHAGLFSALGCGTVKNLTVDHAEVTGINQVGAIVGYGICAKIENCTVSNSTVKAVVKNNDDGDKAGAICGYLSGESTAHVTGCTVVNCAISAFRDCGGAVGMANGPATVQYNTIQNTTISYSKESCSSATAANFGEVVGRQGKNDSGVGPTINDNTTSGNTVTPPSVN